MKKIILLSMMLGVYAMPTSAAGVDTDHLMFPEEVEATYLAANEQAAMDQVFDDASAYTVADNSDVRTKAIQRKFTSRRALNTRSFSGSTQQYDENAAWIGATQKFDQDQAGRHGKRLNKMFKSRRAFRP